MAGKEFHIENLHVPGGEYQTPPTRPPSRMNQNDAPKIENYGGDASGGVPIPSPSMQRCPGLTGLW